MPRDAARVTARPRVRRDDVQVVDLHLPARRQHGQERPRRVAQVPARHVRVVADRLSVMIAAHRRDLPRPQQPEGLLWKQPVVDDVSAAHPPLDTKPPRMPESVAQRVDVRVHVADHPEPRHVASNHSDATVRCRSAGSQLIAHRIAR
jgi:hypothetical protein